MNAGTATIITSEQIEDAARTLAAGLPFRMEINGFGGQRRMVIAPFPDTQELMVAVEGGGCAFLVEGIRHNRFIFIQHSFQMPHAEAAENLLNGVADFVASANAAANPEPLALEDQSKQ